jgi:hypothetical protein
MADLMAFKFHVDAYLRLNRTNYKNLMALKLNDNRLHSK